MRDNITKQLKKRVFSCLLNTSVAIILIIGNSSYTVKIKGQSNDSLRPNISNLRSNSDGISSIQISIPSKKMIRRADAEIRRNMEEYIDMINGLKLAHPEYTNGDIEMSLNFKNSHYLSINKSTLIDSDLLIDLSFKAENIQFENRDILEQADEAINQEFEWTFQITTGNQYNNGCADIEINKLFYNENQ